MLLALLVLHRAKLLASNQSILALGVAPRQVAGTPVPVFSPFPGERGQGDRDSKLEVCFKNRLFLQAGSFKPLRLFYPWLKPCHKAVKCGRAYIAAYYSAVDDDKVHSDVIKRVSAVIGVIGYNICILYCVLAIIQR